jgi:PKD repeat protein
MQSFQILPAPVANFNADLVCAGQEVILDNRTTWTDGAISYTWNLGDGNSSNTTHASHVYATAGNVNVTLTAEIIGGCSDQVSKTINVNPAPSRCDFIANQDFANGFRNFTFVPTDGNNNGTETGVNYTWYYGDGTQGSDNNRDYAIDGAFTVTMRAETSAGCFCESTQQVVVDRLNNEQIGNQTDFNIYPNPNNGTFNIEITGNHQQSTIEIYSLVGELIASYNVENNQVKTITLDNISKGIYLVKVNNEQNNKVRKVHIH